MIEAIELSKRYGEQLAVDRVSFRVEEGELLVLVGGSGSGKTSTLKLVNRLIEPSSGHVEVDGEDVSELPAHELRRRIGYVFQGLGLFPHLTVAENISITPDLLGWSRERQAARCRELLELVQLPMTLAARYPRELSGGQEQRVAVARALAAEPRVLLLDEPFGALDPLTRDSLQRAFHELRERLTLSAILVTHDMSEALLLADRIAVLRDGRLVQQGAPSELLHAPSDAYVEHLLDTPRRNARDLERFFGRAAAS